MKFFHLTIEDEPSEGKTKEDSSTISICLNEDFLAPHHFASVSRQLLDATLRSFYSFNFALQIVSLADSNIKYLVEGRNAPLTYEKVMFELLNLRKFSKNKALEKFIEENSQMKGFHLGFILTPERRNILDISSVCVECSDFLSIASFDKSIIELLKVLEGKILPEKEFFRDIF